jgi:hypothetical protein
MTAARDRVDDFWETRGEIVAVAGEQPHAFGVQPIDDAKTL